MLTFDDILQRHFFSFVDAKSSRRFVFVWFWKRPRYRLGYHEFFVLADGRLWPAITSHGLLDGYEACRRACACGLSLDESLCSEWHEEYVLWERYIIERFYRKDCHEIVCA